MGKPYVVSADISLLLSGWASERRFVLPSNDFVAELRAKFFCFMQGVFSAFEFVPEGELAEGMVNLVSQSGLTPVSLDRVYFHSSAHLDIARHVDNTGNDQGLIHRPNTLPLLQQFKKLKEAGLREVILVDDVVFTGDLLERVIRCLFQIGIRVPLVCAGIGIAEGIYRINQSRCEVRCVRNYEEVIDEVCERDFYPGIPLSGRLLAGGENVGVPYLLPFGKPGQWASIPVEWQVPFSRFCIQQTVQLFEEIERCSNRVVKCCELGRLVATLPRDGTRFIDSIQNL